MSVVEYRDSALSLASWTAIGPYESADGSKIWDQCQLGGNGDTETAIDVNHLEKLIGELATTVAGQNNPRALSINGSPFVDFQNLYDFPYIPTEPARAAYAACCIHCEKPATAYLLVGSADAEKIWLNGISIGGGLTRRSVNTYDDVIAVSLLSGDNLLLIKVVRWSNTTWGFTARLEPSAMDAAASSLAAQGMLQSLLLTQNVFGQGQPLELRPRGVPYGLPLETSLLRSDGIRILSWRAICGYSGRQMTDVPDGLYKVAISVRKSSYSEGFYKGIPEDFAKSLENRARRLSPDPEFGDYLATLQTRLDILLQPANRQFSADGPKRDWQRKLVYTFTEYDSALRRAETGQENVRDQPGLHFGAFRSDLDGQLETYRVFVPSTYHREGPGLGLIIMLPTVTSASHPFISSAFVAAHSEAERISALAERFGVGVLWSGYRNQPAGHPCEFEHFDEVLRAVGGNYHIDLSRVSLLGTCSGGAIATMVAARWPNRFSGIGLLDPMLRLDKTVQDRVLNMFSEIPEFEAWAGHGDDTAAFLKENWPPVYLIHDGAEPGHGDLDVSVEFYENAKAAGHPITFVRRSQTLAQHFGAWEELIDWLAQQRNTKADKRWNPAFAPRPGEGGTVENVLSARFILVGGTGGEKPDHVGVERVVGNFQDAWRETHYGTCRYTTDEALTDADEKSSNLVLVGNAKINRIWSRLAASLPLKMESNKFVIKGRQIAGNDLSLAAVLPNPEQPGRWLILIGALSIGDANFGTLKLSTEGWFGYAIWTNTIEGPKLVAAGLN